MATTEEKTVKIRHENAHQNGTLYYRVYKANDRTRRAVLGLLACWVMAGITLFIPIAHFVLVPGFLIAGPAVAVWLYRQVSAMENVKGQCPKCRETVTIDLEANDQLPKWTYCPACNASVQLTD